MICCTVVGSMVAPAFVVFSLLVKGVSALSPKNRVRAAPARYLAVGV